jgi:hypothetical protein
MLHFIYWNYRLELEKVLDGKAAALSIENKQQPQLKRSC